MCVRAQPIIAAGTNASRQRSPCARRHSIWRRHLEIDVHRGGGGHVRGVAVTGEGASIEDGEVGTPKVGQILLGGPDQHVVHEQAVVRTCADHPNLVPRLRPHITPVDRSGAATDYIGTSHKHLA